MLVKHFTKIEDFNKNEYLEVCRRAEIFQEGIEKNKSFSHLCPGKVLATLFFQESTRTSTGLQAAIIKLGGGYVGISGTAGTYVGSGEEDVGEFINSYMPFCDIMAIRHKSLELDDIIPNLSIPLINAMCGGDEHSLSGLKTIYSLSRRFPKLDNLKCGFYGMIRSSRPAKAHIKALSIFGATIYEDPVIKEFETPTPIREFVKKNGTALVKQKFEDFVNEVDFLFVVEGLPQPGEDKGLVKKYNQQFKPITLKTMKLLKPRAVVIYCQPAKMTNGKSTIEKGVEKDPKIINPLLFKEWIYMNMGLITYLLKVPVR